LPDIPKWSPPSLSFGVHRVRRGETLSGIASRYRTNVHELMALNHLRSANRIWPGQRLQVPGGGGRGRVSYTPGTAMHHRVRGGDSLWLLASRYGTTVDRIRRDNGLRGNLLHPGQVLTIHPGSSGRGGVYVVRKGDTLAAIAHDQGVPLGRLLAANRLSRASTIYPGQQLTIPD
jgi:membrane-bound lytic murein transglycosylase D